MSFLYTEKRMIKKFLETKKLFKRQIDKNQVLHSVLYLNKYKFNY